MRKLLHKIASSEDFGEILKKGGISFLSRVFSFFIAYVFYIYVTRTYSQESVGLFQLSNSIIIISALIISLGFQKSVVRFASELSSQHNLLKLRRVVFSFMRIILPLAVVLGALYFVFAEQWSVALFNDEKMGICLMFIGAVLPFYVTYWILTEFYRGMNMFKRSELLKFSGLWICTIGICVSISFVWKNPYVPLLAYVSAIGLMLLIGLPKALKMLKNFNQRKNEEDSSFDFVYYLKTSFPMIITSLSFILLIRMDFVMLGIFKNVSIEEIAVYGIAVKFGVLANFANQALQRMSAPKISKLFWANEQNKLRKLIFNVKRINLFVTLPICLIIFLFTKEFLQIFGQEYAQGGVNVARIIAIAYFINAYFGLSGVFMNMTGNQNQFMFIMLFTIALNFVLNLILIPDYGIIGPAISTCLCFFIWNLTTTIYLYRKYKIKMYYIPFVSAN